MKYKCKSLGMSAGAEHVAVNYVWLPYCRLWAGSMECTRGWKGCPSTAHTCTDPSITKQDPAVAQCHQELGMVHTECGW